MSNPNESEVSPTPSDKAAGGGRRPSACSLPSHFRGPFKHHPSAGVIFDGNGTHVLDVRGWGYLTGRGEGGLRILEGPAAIIQDQLGDWVAAALTAACAENAEMRDRHLKQTPPEKGNAE